MSPARQRRRLRRDAIVHIRRQLRRCLASRAWCSVADKAQLHNEAEAARVLKPGGVVACTDRLGGDVALSDAGLERLLCFMKFLQVESIAKHRKLLTVAGRDVIGADDTLHFAGCVDPYLARVDRLLIVDALRLLNVDLATPDAVAAGIICAIRHALARLHSVVSWRGAHAENQAACPNHVALSVTKRISDAACRTMLFAGDG